MIRMMQAKKPVQMDFPTLPTECVRYVWFNPTESEDDNSDFRKMKSFYDKMMEIAMKYAKISFDEMMLSRDYLNDRPADFPYYPAKYKYAILRKEKYFFKYHNFCGTFYAKASSYANQISNFLVHAISFQVPTSVDIDGFKKFIEKQFEESTDAKLDLFKYKALYNKLLPFVSKPWPKPPNHNDVQSAMEETIPHVISFIHYCPQTAFDDILFKFFSNSNKLQIIQNFAKSVGAQFQKCIEDAYSVQQPPRNPEGPKKRSERLLNISEIDDSQIDVAAANKGRKSIQPLDLIPLKKFIDGIVASFKTNESLRVILVCAIYRIFFDQMYILYSNVMLEQQPLQMFIKNCNMFRYMTPAELDITEGIFTEQQKKQPFTTIDATVDLFHQAVEYIMVVQFYTNPFDLVYSLFNSMQKFNLIMKRNSLEPKMGVLVSAIDEETIAKLQLAMSFDDFFSIFYAAISISPPANPLSIRDFLIAFSQVKMEPSMTYAASLFSAGVSHLQSVVKPRSKHDPSANSIDDPLEIAT
jgi:hypothetical protein